MNEYFGVWMNPQPHRLRVSLLARFFLCCQSGYNSHHSLRLKEMICMRTLVATRYLTPLREGGSLPAVVEADDSQLYVMKFVGAGQGVKALIAELVAGEIARALDLPIPEMVFLTLDPALGPSEPNGEIHDLLRASVGLNLGFRYLPNAFTFNPQLPPRPDPALASAIVWFDAYVANVDRTLRNINLLVWQRTLWLIDHGAALYFHHNWRDFAARSRSPFALVKDHALLRFASQLRAADEQAHDRLTPAVIRTITDLIPAPWLHGPELGPDPAQSRQVYHDFLLDRLAASALFVQEANRVRV